MFIKDTISLVNLLHGEDNIIDSISFSEDDDKDQVISAIMDVSSEYCLLWDEDSIAVNNLEFFDMVTHKPYLDIESHHVMVKKELFTAFLNNEDVINSGNLIDEYTDFAVSKYPTEYMTRHLRVFEKAGEFFSRETISERDSKWLSIDYDILYFDRKSTFRKDIEALFKDSYYQQKLSPGQMVEAVLAEETTSYDDEFVVGDRLKYLTPDTYKNYEELGDKLTVTNIDQAFLCYENAEFLCDSAAEKRRVADKKTALMNSGKVKVKKAAIVILSYNNKYLMQRCLESIYTNCNPDTYTLIVFDNNSTDGIEKWLIKWGEAHDEAIVVLSDDNLGFSGGCNQAAHYAGAEEDIFLLNNDTRMPANALFWLRMGLYASNDIGASGAIQNYFNNTRDEAVDFAVVEQYMEYGAKKNIFIENALEEQAKLCGFALLVRRSVWDEVGGFDERLNPGYLEDDDICLAIINLGYKLVRVHNSFIYHAGSQSFIKRNDVNEMILEHKKVIIEKWGFDSMIYSSILEEQVEYIETLADKGYTRDSSFSLLHINCGAGGMLAHLRYLYPKAELAGVEPEAVIRRYAVTNVDIYESLNDLPKDQSQYDLVYRSYCEKSPWNLKLKYE